MADILNMLLIKQGLKCYIKDVKKLYGKHSKYISN